MAKKVIRLTESRLRQLVESCVRETMEGMVEEGYGWDALKNIAGSDTSHEAWPEKDEIGEFIKGEPDEMKFRKSRDLYNAAKDGMIYSDGGEHSTDPNDYMGDAVMSEPGFKGKARRTGIAAAAMGKMAFDKGKAGIKRGIRNLRSRNNKGGDAEPFEL